MRKPISTPSRVLCLIADQRRAQSPRLLAASVAGAVVAIASVSLLGLSGWFITGAAIAGLGGLLAVQAFNYLLPAALIRLLAILRTGARYAERVTGHDAALKALSHLRPQIFSALASAPPEQALALSSGEASARMVQDVDAVQTLFVRLSSPWAMGAGAVTATVLAALASPLAALIILIAMGLTAGGAAVIGRTLADAAGRDIQTATGALKARLSALEAAAPELRAYGLEDWAVGDVAASAETLDHAHAAAHAANGWMDAWQALVTGAAVVAVVIAASTAPLPLVALAALAAVTGIEAAGGLVSALRQTGAADEAIRRLDAIAPEAAHSADTANQPPAEARLSIGLTEDLGVADRLAVVGPSGSGKTTLIERLIGLRTPLAGEATLGRHDIADLTSGSARALFAYAAQDVRLVDGTLRQNLRLADPTASDEQMWSALEDAALADRFRHASTGLDTPLGANGGHLSGGERRRLGLARAYLRAAPWLVLDEPTEGLDAATEKTVLDRLDARLRRTGQGLILISHRPAPTALCDQVVTVEGVGADGRITLGAAKSMQPALV